MAKRPAKTKTAAKAPAKAAATKTKAKSSSTSIQKVSEEVLKVLLALDLGGSLQSDIVWCLGSYKHDNNPSGLLDMMEKSLVVLTEEKQKKTKGISAKMILDIESVLKSR